MKRRLVVGSVAAAALMLMAAAGCGNFYLEQYYEGNSDYGSERATRGAEAERRMAVQSPPSRPSGAVTRSDLRARSAETHRNGRLFISEQAMYQLDKIQGIAAAVVLVTDRNAYVGVITDYSSTGTYLYGRTPDVNNVGTSEGVYDADTGRSTLGGRRNAKRLFATPANNLHTVSGREKLSPKLANNIESKVRSMHPHVQDVFISSNRDFVNFLNSYAYDAWNGRRLDNRLDEFARRIRTFGDIWS